MTDTETVATEEKVAKSIVPSKYSAKYKKGGSDELAVFINEQSTGEQGFEFDKFFALCRANGIVDAHITPYEDGIAAKAHGAPGRARMTLRNRLAPIARKTGVLKGLDGKDHPVVLPALPERPKADTAEAA